MNASLTTPLLMSTLLLSTSSFAQPSLTSIAPINWSGYYAGINAGAVKHTLNITDNNATSFYATIQEVSDLNFTGGVQAGYRRQLDVGKTSWLYGLEFSANFSNATFNQNYGSPFALYELNASNSLKNIYLLQLMGGIAADKTLLFLAAGLSWSNITGNMTSLDGVPFFNTLSFNKTAFGTAVGGGIEYAVSSAFSARFKLDVITPNQWLAIDDTGDSFQISNNIVQATVGINYRFG